MAYFAKIKTDKPNYSFVFPGRISYSFLNIESKAVINTFTGMLMEIWQRNVWQSRDRVHFLLTLSSHESVTQIICLSHLLLFWSESVHGGLKTSWADLFI